MSDTQRPATGPTEPQDGLPAFIPYPMPRKLWRAFGAAVIASGEDAAAVWTLAERMAGPSGGPLAKARPVNALKEGPLPILRRALLYTALGHTDLDRGDTFCNALDKGRPAVFGLDNRAMETAINEGTCIDLRGREYSVPGVYLLPEFVEGVDYADSEREAWIWSIARHDETGKVYASTDTRLYQKPGYQCLFLR